tara:strand:- start:2368 stop:2913 length:546 start_codon:yes stop_codon:yes gene_type:complete
MANIDINNIADSVKSYPPLRANRYDVYIQSPVTGFAGPLWATNVTFPGRSLATVERRMFGPQRDMPYERLFSGDLDITFMVTQGNWIRNKMEEWMDKIIDPTTNRLKGDRRDYLGEIEIDMVDMQNSPSGGYGIKVLEVFPKMISPISLSYNSENETVQQSISFSFRNYEQKNESNSNTGP